MLPFHHRDVMSMSLKLVVVGAKYCGVVVVDDDEIGDGDVGKYLKGLVWCVYAKKKMKTTKFE